MIKLQKRVGSIGRLSLETMEVAAEPTLQTDVLAKIDFGDVFLKVQIHEKKLEMAAAEHIHSLLPSLEMLLACVCV